MGDLRRKHVAGVKSGRSFQGVHPRAWTGEGTLRLAFRCIGQLTLGAASMRTTRRELDAISAVALAAVDKAKTASRTTAMVLRANRPKWFFMGRSHDCTPVRVSFGLLGDLASCARYWHRPSKHAAATLLDWATYSAVSRVGRPTHGIVELFAQTARLAWPSRAVNGPKVHIKNLRFPAAFLSRSNASTLFAALDSADDALALDAILSLTAAVDVVVIFLNSDLASSCSRVKMEYARRVMEANKV